MRFSEIMGHQSAIERLQKAIGSGNIPSMLFAGEPGIGKLTVAFTFAQTLLCLDRLATDGWAEPCGVCLACKKFVHKNHHDFRLIEPLEDDKGKKAHFIKIEQIRKMQEGLIFAPMEGQKKVVIVHPFDRLNMESANGLLKTLEEPPGDVVLILVGENTTMLPGTLLSRCVKIPFHPLSFSQIETFLTAKKQYSVQEARLVTAMAGGRLASCLRMDVETAKKREEQMHALVAEDTLLHYDRLFETVNAHARDEEAMEAALHYLLAWFRDVLVAQATTSPLDASWFVYGWRLSEIKTWAGRMDAQEVGAFMAQMQAIQQAQVRNINRVLSLETLLMKLRDKIFP